jgi:hypothetical protein
MGMDQTTYVGPYIKIKKLNIKPIESSKKEIIFTCSNKSCSIHGKKAVGKFCSECGQSNGNVSITRKIVEVPSSYQLLYDFGQEDLLRPQDSKNEIFYLPNQRNNYSINVDSDDSFIEKEIIQTPEDIKSQFTQDYQEFLDFLTEKEIPFTISFGVITYWS